MFLLRWSMLFASAYASALGWMVGGIRSASSSWIAFGYTVWRALRAFCLSAFISWCPGLLVLSFVLGDRRVGQRVESRLEASIISR
jgi:hypothetical protein